MCKRILAMLLIMVMCTTMLFVDSPFNPTVKALASSYKNGFSVVPEKEKEDETGVALDSGFILTAQESITLDYVKANVSLRNGEPLKAVQTPDGSFLLKPAQPLEQNKIYFIDIKTPAGQTVSFAFQTTRDFSVLGSLPENMSSNVPVDTGIELYFSYPDIKDIAKYFEISPKVEGRFETDGYTTVFIPKKLEEKTIYTVTVKKGLAYGKGAVLQNDYTFSFETSANINSTANPSPGSLYVSSDWFEFGSMEKPAIPFELYLNSRAPSAELTLKVFQFKTPDEFVKALREKEKSPSWAPFAAEKNKLKTDSLDKVLEFKQTFDLTKWQSKYMMFPETIKEGFYLIELSNEDLSAQAFLQITDVLSYIVGDKDSTLLWLNNLKSGLPEKSAQVSYYDGGENLQTNTDGLVKLSNPKKTDTENIAARDLYKVKTADGRLSVLNAGYSYQPYENNGNEGLYWRYIQTDRTLYKPNDNVAFWGYIKSRTDGSVPDKVTVELANGAYRYPVKINGGRYIPFLSNPLDTLTLEANNGFYEGNIKLPALDPGSYTITVKDGDTVLSRTYFSVENYVKPQYQLEISSDKKAVFVGDKIKFTIKASFFDGTPVSNVPLNYSIDTYSNTVNGKGVTDLNGALDVEYTPDYNSDMQGDFYYTLHASAQFPETGEISEYYNFRVFANDITFQANGEIDGSKGTLDLTAHRVKLDSLNDEDPQNDDYLGNPAAAQSFKVNLYQIIWEKTEVGEEYDAINKVVRKLYEYREKSTPAGHTTLTTDKEGKAQYKFSADMIEAGFCKAEITTKDHKGRTMKRTVRLYAKGGTAYPRDYEYYTLKADKERYKTGETVTAQVMKNDQQPLKNMRTLFVQARNGIQHYQVNSQPAFSGAFPGNYAPNYYLNGIVFNGKSYIETTRAIAYDYNEKKLDLDVRTDKSSYKPGETMTVSVKAADINGKAVPAMVNISLVDEALLKLSGQDLNPLTELYSWIPDGLISHYGYPVVIRSARAGGALYGSTVNDMANSAEMKAAESEAPAAMPTEAPAGAMDGGAAPVRSDFKDTALFKTIQLDENGFGTYTFKLPDNITSFSLAAAAVSSDLHAGSDIQSAKVSMPFFINDSLSLDYLKGDKPYVGLTAYGESLAENEDVSFEITVRELPDFKQTASAKAFERVYLPLPEALSEGSYTLVMTARSKTGKSDSLSRTITVYPSYRTIETATVKDLAKGLKMDAGESGITTLIFSDAGKARLLHSLLSLSWDFGKRLDQKLVADSAGTLLEEVLKNESYKKPEIKIDTASYKNDDGGYGILPYAQSDPEFTALITGLMKNAADVNSLKLYFYEVMASGNTVPASALYALAVLNEPVLLDLDRTAAVQNLSTTDYIFLGLAYEALGDLSKAQELYENRVAPQLERKNPYIRIKVRDGNTDVSYKETALAAVLASGVNSPDAEKLYAYTENNSSKTQYIGVEKILYLQHEITKLSDTPASFEYRMGGKTYTAGLEGGRCEILKIPSVNIGQFEVLSVTGDISVLSLYTAAFAKTDNDAGITMTRKYYDAATGKETSVFQANDLVKVEISYNIDKTAIDNTYEISDYAPAGLKPLDNPWSHGIRDAHGWYYRQFDGQKVTFVVGKNSDENAPKPLVYYARVASPGTYIAEGTVAQGSIVKSSIVTAKDAKIVIKP